MAALRAGAGLVTVAAPRSIQSTIAGFAPELMTEALEETVFGTVPGSALENISATILRQTHNVLALGPGLSRNKESGKFARALTELCPYQIVLDADGLNAFEGCSEKLNGSKRSIVITPHPGEMARLTGKTVAEVQSDRINIARSFAQQHSIYVVLKGHRTIVAEPGGRIWINPTGNPGMATGGTGDILTGILAGLLAQAHGELAHAVIAAVWLHGAAGDIARDVMGERSLIATDLLSAMPKAFADAMELAETGEINIHNEFNERA
jgi:NAD(P)H-hydrate epimerase